jgi:hypothetical protein
MTAIEAIGTNGLRHWIPRKQIIREDVLPIGEISDPPLKKFEICYDRRGKKKKTVPNRLDISI